MSNRPVTTARVWLRISPMLVMAVPAVVVRLTGYEPAPISAALIFGAAIVGASFMLAWAAEAAEHDVAGGLAIAIVAFVAVLPEYAVDAYFAYQGGTDPVYRAYATANMTGSNRLLIGIGWPLVVLLTLLLRRNSHPRARAIQLEPTARIELAFLLLGSALVVVVVATARIPLVIGVMLLLAYVWYLRRLGQAEVVEPELIGTAATIGALPVPQRRATVTGMFAIAALLVLLSAAPFADGLIATGTQFGIDRFLLVQWVAPLASEAPEFIIALLFALRSSPTKAMGILLSSKVNQWLLLFGGLPIVYAIGGGGFVGLPLGTRQVAEVALTLAQTMLGVALLLRLRISAAAATLLLLLFLSQFVFTGTTGRHALSLIYVVLAVAVAWRNRDGIPPLLRTGLGAGRGAEGPESGAPAPR